MRAKYPDSFARGQRDREKWNREMIGSRDALVRSAQQSAASYMREIDYAKAKLEGELSDRAREQTERNIAYYEGLLSRLD